MSEMENRFGWRVKDVIDLIEKERYREAFDRYSILVRFFKSLDGYSDEEWIKFYRKVKNVGDMFLFRLCRKKVDNKELSLYGEFNRKLLNKTISEDVCKLIEKEKFEEALKKYVENK